MPTSGPTFRVPRRAAAAGMLLVVCAALAPAVVAPPVLADEPELADRWMDPAAARIGLHKVLIVGITKDPKARRHFEDRFVTVLRTHNTEGVTSYSIVSDLQAPGDPEEIMKTLFAQRVDGVITVRLKPVDAKSEEAWAAGWRAAQQEPLRARAYIEAALRETNPEADDFAAEVTLWAMGSVEPGRRIWAGRFPRQSIKYLRKHVNEMVQLVVDEMQYKDLF